MPQVRFPAALTLKRTYIRRVSGHDCMRDAAQSAVVAGVSLLAADDLSCNAEPRADTAMVQAHSL